MTAFFAMFSLFLKNRFCSRSFISVLLSVIILISGFAFLAPPSAYPSAKAGIIFENSDQRLYQSCCNLLNLQETDFIRYHDEQLLRRDVMNGTLHCGYKLDASAKVPITVFETEGSILTPILDEMVFSAWFEAHMLNSTPELYGSEYRKLIASEIERLSIQHRPLAVDITINTLSPDRDKGTASFAPVLYSVCIPLVLLAAAFCAMLSSEPEKNAIQLLFLSSNSRIKTVSAFFFAHTSCFLVLPLFFELLFSLMQIPVGFSCSARVVSVLFISLSAALIFCLFSAVRPNSLMMFICTVWAALSIIFSGAFISPSVFGVFEPIKFFSPSWLLLQLMSVLTVI